MKIKYLFSLLLLMNNFLLISQCNNCQLFPAQKTNTNTNSAVAYSPVGNCLALAQADSVVMFRSNADCTITEVQNLPFINQITQSLAFSPTGNCLAVAFRDSIRVFSVNRDCILNEVAGSPYISGSNPTSLSYSPMVIV